MPTPPPLPTASYPLSSLLLHSGHQMLRNTDDDDEHQRMQVAVRPQRPYLYRRNPKLPLTAK